MRREEGISKHRKILIKTGRGAVSKKEEKEEGEEKDNRENK